MISRSRWMASCGTRQERAIDEQEALLGAVGAAHHDPARQAEVAVEPGVEQGAAVDLDGQLAVARPTGVRVRLDPQVRAVGVGADDPEPAAGPWWAPVDHATRLPPRSTKCAPGPVGPRVDLRAGP